MYHVGLLDRNALKLRINIVKILKNAWITSSNILLLIQFWQKLPYRTVGLAIAVPPEHFLLKSRSSVPIAYEE